jgi:hypothetical protein
MEPSDRYRGALLGLAIGDTNETMYEFQGSGELRAD